MRYETIDQPVFISFPVDFLHTHNGHRLHVIFLVLCAVFNFLTDLYLLVPVAASDFSVVRDSRFPHLVPDSGILPFGLLVAVHLGCVSTFDLVRSG